MLQIILEAIDTYVNPDCCPTCPVVPGECAYPSQWSQGRRAGDTILPLGRCDPRRHVPSSSWVPRIFPLGGRIRWRVRWGASAVRRAGDTSTHSPQNAHTRAHTHVFWLSSLFPFARCLLWCKMLSPNKEGGRARSMWQICRLSDFLSFTGW